MQACTIGGRSLHASLRWGQNGSRPTLLALIGSMISMCCCVCHVDICQISLVPFHYMEEMDANVWQRSKILSTSIRMPPTMKLMYLPFFITSLSTALLKYPVMNNIVKGGNVIEIQVKSELLPLSSLSLQITNPRFGVCGREGVLSIMPLQPGHESFVFQIVWFVFLKQPTNAS